MWEHSKNVNYILRENTAVKDTNNASGLLIGGKTFTRSNFLRIQVQIPRLNGDDYYYARTAVCIDYNRPAFELKLGTSLPLVVLGSIHTVSVKMP